jgi:DNA-binding Lrp family transcriptional regulator
MRNQQELCMSQKDWDRLKVLHAAKKGLLTQKQAGMQLRLSERWVRKLLVRLREEGEGGIVHRLRGRTSKRRLPEAVRQKVVRLVKREYADFGPTLAAEYLAQQHRVQVSKETLRQILMAAGVWKRKRRRVEEVHVWRARRACWGELVQWDTSEHDWLEGRGPKLYLMAMIDDATSRALACFAAQDKAQENLRLLASYLQQWGRPVAFYTDKDSMFTVNQPRREAKDEAWPEVLTQIGRALRELGISWLPAHSPQAKGRVERFFGTAQDRLVKGLRKAGVSTLEEANRYLGLEYLPQWNSRFSREPANPSDAHRPLRREQDLAAILSHVEERVVANDYTIRYNNKQYQIARTDIRPGLRGATVRVEQRWDERVWVRFRDSYLNVQICDPQIRPQPPPARPREKRTAETSKDRESWNWMEGFRLRKSLPVWKVIKQDAGGWVPGEGPGSADPVGR